MHRDRNGRLTYLRRKKPKEDTDMAKVESRSERPDFFAQGGDGHMFGKGHASCAEAGVSGKQSQGTNDGQTPQKKGDEGYGSGMKYAEGGSGHMFGKGHAGRKVPGVSGKETQVG